MKYTSNIQNITFYRYTVTALAAAEDSKPETKEIEQVAAPYGPHASRRYHVPVEVSPTRGEPFPWSAFICLVILAISVQSAMKFWRTPAGKLVKLDPKAPALGARAAFAGVVNAQPKFIRLANGKLARISTKVGLPSKSWVTSQVMGAAAANF